ncbi:MAG: DNA gyrase inhibitor YacG [Gammaproteobacteria bacterium]|nr:DNA gyrase inhibitor YacG [Gammaproteobacteria bacterium]
MSSIVKCPTCQKDVVWQPESEYRPFCSKRCQMIDLGEWASENNRIAQSPQVSEISEADLDKMEAFLTQQDNDFFKN